VFVRESIFYVSGTKIFLQHNPSNATEPIDPAKAAVERVKAAYRRPEGVALIARRPGALRFLIFPRPLAPSAADVAHHQLVAAHDVVNAILKSSNQFCADIIGIDNRRP